MARWIHGVALATVVVTAPGLGCRPTRAAPLAELELPDRVQAPRDGTFAEQRVLIRRFTDARPPRYSKLLATTSIPGVNLVHAGTRYEYSEHNGAYVKTRDGDTTVHVGWLPLALPHLLRRSLPGSNAVVADDLPAAGADAHWDYVVEGRILKTQLTEHRSFVLLMMSLIGTPPYVYTYDLDLEISVYATAAPNDPVLERTYNWRDRRAEGLYYNHRTPQTLPQRALEETLAEASRDIVREVAAHRIRRRHAPTGAIAAKPAAPIAPRPRRTAHATAVR